jgi:hypothetical protein
VFVVVITLVVYEQVWEHEFVNYDDPDYVTENEYVQKGLTAESIQWAFTTGHASNWHPLTWLSLMLDHELFGLNGGGFHVVNLLFHTANTLLLLLVLHKMTGALYRSVFVALLFAVHPLHVESVAWVAERKDVLSTFFWFFTMWVYVDYVKRGGWGLYVALTVAFGLGLMSKPMLVTLPFVLLLLDYWPLERLRFDGNNFNQKCLRLLVEKVPLFFLAACSSVITIFAQRGGGSVISAGALSIWGRLSNAIVSYLIYMWKMIVPMRLAVFYPYMKARGVGETVAAAALLVCITLVIILVGRRCKYLVTGWLWYVGTLVPVIGIVQVGAQAYADRYTYVPIIGLFIIVAWGAVNLMGRWRYRKAVLAMGGIVVVGLLAVVTWIHLGRWCDTVTLFEHALAVTEDNCVAHNVLANTYGQLGDMDKSIGHGQEALRIFPQYDSAHYNLGMAYYGKGELTKAIEHWENALRIEPTFKDANYNIGVALESMGQAEQVAHYYKRELAVNPGHTGAQKRLKALNTRHE